MSNRLSRARMRQLPASVFVLTVQGFYFVMCDRDNFTGAVATVVRKCWFEAWLQADEFL
ncbi:hypothetical protein [Leptolyngbya sp. FACHB-17]|uniref:hypothetical protein n=1 Tax=Leptolyngbya sp. FACHB-17 TaxID=2692803 RepID=UPI001681945B|nr:hypothetical protein [Leptolyngbya sp. FACHB-17]MBD2080423.1 hypothetical protein [Leptolyngbya sp. FACHB-17]